jgi:hypothetical protein
LKNFHILFRLSLFLPRHGVELKERVKVVVAAVEEADAAAATARVV